MLKQGEQMVTDADKTPIVGLSPMDELLVKLTVLERQMGEMAPSLENLGAIKVYVKKTADTQLEMYEHQKREGLRLRIAIGTCVACALICVACTFLTYSAVASAAVRLERLPAAVHP